jgi:hypothetical protein
MSVFFRVLCLFSGNYFRNICVMMLDIVLEKHRDTTRKGVYTAGSEFRYST